MMNASIRPAIFISVGIQVEKDTLLQHVLLSSRQVGMTSFRKKAKLVVVALD